jgi:hypothetical protein
MSYLRIPKKKPLCLRTPGDSIGSGAWSIDACSTELRRYNTFIARHPTGLRRVTDFLTAVGASEVRTKVISKENWVQAR